MFSMGLSSRAVGLKKIVLYNFRLEVRQVFFFQLQFPEVISEISIFAGLLASPIRSPKQGFLPRALRRVSFLLRPAGFPARPRRRGDFSRLEQHSPAGVDCPASFSCCLASAVLPHKRKIHNLKKCGKFFPNL